jgi:hypothetical protein
MASSIEHIRTGKLRPELCGRLGDEVDQAAWWAGISMTSMPFWNLTPWTTFGNWFSPFNRRQVFAAAMPSLNTINLAVVADRDPFVRTVRWRTVANTLSMTCVDGPSARPGSRRRRAELSPVAHLGAPDLDWPNPGLDGALRPMAVPHDAVATVGHVQPPNLPFATSTEFLEIFSRKLAWVEMIVH